MNFIDMHCDTASELLYQNLNLKESNLKVDINKLKKGNALAQFFAFFIELQHTEDPFLEFKKQYNNFMKEIEVNNKEIEVVRSFKELTKCNKEGKIGAFLTIEEGEVLDGKIERVKEVYDLGVRLITLTWNYHNKLGYPNCGFQYKDEGLTPKGKEIVEYMEELGVIPDCSHLSDGGFYDLVDICKKPFVASHSNSRYVTNHPRNLSDEMIKKLANKGGVMGLNFCADFLGDSEVSSIDEMICHIKHIYNVGGIDILALGSDFDGIDNEVEIRNTSEMMRLSDRLQNEGFKDNEIEKIFFRNTERVLKETLK